MQTIHCSKCRQFKERLGSTGGSRGQPRICKECQPKAPGKSAMQVLRGPR